MKYKNIIIYILIFALIAVSVIFVRRSIVKDRISRLPHKEEISDFQKQIEEEIWKQTKDTFSDYYELLGYKIDDYEEFEEDGVLNAIFSYTFYHKNYDKDPDTVPYIQEAKEKNDPNYEIYYDEYLEEKDGLMFLRAVQIDSDKVKFYVDSGYNREIVWIELNMDDFLIVNK